MDGAGGRRDGEDAAGSRDRAAVLRGLREALARRAVPEPSARVLPGGVLPFGVPAMDDDLRGGLALGALHEIAPAEEADAPAALGFVAALLARLAAARPDPAGGDMLLVLPDSEAALDGHGLASLGLPPERLLILRVGTPRAAFFALEEGLRTGALTAVVGVVEERLDLARSRRLQLAGEAAGPLLLVLRPAGAEAPNAAATRWRIAAARARLDRFGDLDRACWEVELARCRNGRPGRWLLEWDHAAHRLGLAGALGDRAPPAGLSARRRA